MSTATLATVDRIEVLILVDNVTDYLSSVPSYVESRSRGSGSAG